MKLQKKTRKPLVALVLFSCSLAGAIGAQEGTGKGGLIQLALVMNQSQYGNKKLSGDVLVAATRAFADSRRFAIVERANLKTLLAEKDLEDFIQQANAGGMTDLDGVDMVGILSYEVERGGVSTYYRISVQLTSTKTGRVTDTLTSDRETFREPTTVFIAGKHLYENIKEKFPPSGWVIEARGSDVVVDLGARDGVAEGDRIEVFQEGEPVIHPVTGELLEGRQTLLAVLKVTSVQTQMSTCKLKGEGTVEVGDRVKLGEKNVKGRSMLGKALRGLTKRNR